MLYNITSKDDLWHQDQVEILLKSKLITVLLTIAKIS